MKVRKVFLLKEAISDIEEGRIFYDKIAKANHLIHVALKIANRTASGLAS